MMESIAVMHELISEKRHYFHNAQIADHILTRIIESLAVRTL